MSSVLWRFILTHWGRVTHICVSDLTSIGSDNGLSPGRRQAIIRTNAEILLIRPLGTNFSDFFCRNSNIFIQENAFESIVCEEAAILSRPQWVKIFVGPLRWSVWLRLRPVVLYDTIDGYQSKQYCYWMNYMLCLPYQARYSMQIHMIGKNIMVHTNFKSNTHKCRSQSNC